MEIQKHNKLGLFMGPRKEEVAVKHIWAYHWLVSPEQSYSTEKSNIYAGEEDKGFWDGYLHIPKSRIYQSS